MIIYPMAYCCQARLNLKNTTSTWQWHWWVQLPLTVSRLPLLVGSRRFPRSIACLLVAVMSCQPPPVVLLAMTPYSIYIPALHENRHSFSSLFSPIIPPPKLLNPKRLLHAVAYTQISWLIYLLVCFPGSVRLDNAGGCAMVFLRCKYSALARRAARFNHVLAKRSRLG